MGFALCSWFAVEMCLTFVGSGHFKDGGLWMKPTKSPSHSKVRRNLFSTIEKGRRMRGEPPLPDALVLPEEADERAPEGNTKFPKELTVLPFPAPELRRPNEEVTRFGDPMLKEFIVQMLGLLTKGTLVGLTAPQLGTNLRIMVMNIDKVDWNIDPFQPEKKYGNLVFINPKIISYSDAYEEGPESGLSLVDVEGTVKRSAWVEFEYQDFLGKKFKRMFKGFPARVFQHSYDHLGGIMFIDRLDSQQLQSQQQYLDVLTQAYVKRTAVHYEKLGLEYGTEPTKVKSQFKKMMVKYHPDKNPSADDLEKFKEMRESYGVLRRKLGL